MIMILKTDIMDPVMQCTTLPSHSESLKRFLFHFSRRSTRFYRLSHSEIVDIEKVAVRSSLRLPNNKCALIELYGGGGNPFQLKSDSLPHAHAQITKTYYKHQDSRIKKAQELKTKTSAYSDIKDNSSEIKLHWRLLASFQ
ncbi:hypothetical protein Tco_0858915 [Tanacetum coccineum]|uniref:Uncharacterized protein n=1 Tax=Tanacetum coccineum TaxID=301880 RepID=A0ABQ5BBI5_9ASTR